ncbi:MAG: DUF3307 domain-containing protein [Cyanobacteriota bacterium]|nr:DUF3307 domain-containing protein [Cyanobacteriota bacterium]
MIGPGIPPGLDLLILLAMAHFVCDFSLQGDRMARQKCPGASTAVPWFWWLLAHAACHGLAVSLLSGSALLGLAETASHAAIDHLKCRSQISFSLDQGLHLACKAAWVAALAIQGSGA